MTYRFERRYRMWRISKALLFMQRYDILLTTEFTIPSRTIILQGWVVCRVVCPKLQHMIIFVHDRIKISSRTIVLQAWVSSVVCLQS